jgi:hypothetical protein
LKSSDFIFEGVIVNREKNGEGVMLTRKGMLIVGTWKHDQLEGRAIIFTPFGGQIYLKFNEGKVNGWVFALYS